MKKRHPHSIFRVLTAIPLASASGRKILNGVHRFLSEGYDWDIELIRHDNDFHHLLEVEFDCSDFDGMLVAYAEDDDLRQKQLAIDLPTVFVDSPDPTRKAIAHLAFVRDDERSIAAVAVQHLLSCGIRESFGYVPTRESRPWSNRRLAAFRERMRQVGREILSFDGESREELRDWLRNLPKPTAVLAAFDDRALDVLEVCRSVGLAVPSEVAVLGIGNDEAICESSVPPLSSVNVDFEAQGYRAARELQALMLGGSNPKTDIRFGARDVVRRSSTTGSVPATTLVRRALEFIRANALGGISSRDVAAHLRVSRRLVDLRFRAIRGQSVLDAILDVRLGEVKRLLRETDLRLDEIADRCGYRSSDVLRVLFKRRTGLSPRAWRKAADSAESVPKIRGHIHASCASVASFGAYFSSMR